MCRTSVECPGYVVYYTREAYNCLLYTSHQPIFLKLAVRVHTFTLQNSIVSEIDRLPKIGGGETKMWGGQNCEKIAKVHVGYQIKENFNSVSYTHLDVYKRQICLVYYISILDFTKSCEIHCIYVFVCAFLLQAYVSQNDGSDYLCAFVLVYCTGRKYMKLLSLITPTCSWVTYMSILRFWMLRLN